MTEKKSANERLQKKMFCENKSSWLDYDSSKKRDVVFNFSEDYKNFLRQSKTERQCVANVISSLKKSGFKNIESVKKLKKGDRAFKAWKGKAVLAFVVGNNPEELRLIGSHVDSPRLDLKPNPLSEDSDLAILKTHYYGGIKKYQWVNTPLEMHGVVFSKNGKKINISIGDKDDDPIFIVPDLLIHLAREQMEKNAKTVVEGEQLKVLVGNIPVNDEKIKEPIKFSVMKELYEKYNMTEEDFMFAELELVPKNNPSDVGFDRSLIAAYGQDDKVCVYTSLMALKSIKSSKCTALGMFVDKEEIGSMGDTGAESFILKNFAQDYIIKTGLKINADKLLETSKAISADVTAAVNPNHKEVHDPTNASYLGRGVSVEKYGGGGGKYSTNDASAEFMNFIRQIIIKKNIPWQTGELGKIDVGGGGTIAMFISRYGMDCVDAGPCILGMHSPYEITSKIDIYSAYLLYKEFFNS